MSLRNRLLRSALALVLGPLLVLVVVIREETAKRLEREYVRRVDSLIAVIEGDLEEQARRLAARLTALSETVAEDDQLRLALGGDDRFRAYRLNWAGRAATLTGLALLQLQDETGTILSSGHFRNEFDRVDAQTPEWLASAPRELTLLEARRPTGPFWALARVDSVRLANRTLRVVGGVEIDRGKLAALAPDDDLVVTLEHPGGTLRPDGVAADPLTAPAAIVRALRLPALPLNAAPTRREARFVVTHSLSPMRALLKSLDAWLFAAWGLVALGTILLAIRFSSRIARPLETLARQTASLDLDKLDADFDTDRRDEVGTLSRFLGEMTVRLRTSVSRLRDAERRATLGDVARQVNHDLRNGFTPIRNVVRHLSQVASDSPQDLPRVFDERHGTLESGLTYLEQLASSYSRMSPGRSRVRCDLGHVVRQAAEGRMERDEGPVRLSLAPDLPPVLADPVGLRRVVENLLANSCESLRGDGCVRVATERAKTGTGDPAVCLTVADDGAGIPPDHLDRIFDPFFTTKETGGLGLSIVRRLLSDWGGTIRVESEPDHGTRCTVVLPAAITEPVS
jgi:signal transduction histidine kinase